VIRARSFREGHPIDWPGALHRAGGVLAEFAEIGDRQPSSGTRRVSVPDLRCVAQGGWGVGRVCGNRGQTALLGDSEGVSPCFPVRCTGRVGCWSSLRKSGTDSPPRGLGGGESGDRQPSSKTRRVSVPVGGNRGQTALLGDSEGVSPRFAVRCTGRVGCWSSLRKSGTDSPPRGLGGCQSPICGVLHGEGGGVGRIDRIDLIDRIDDRGAGSRNQGHGRRSLAALEMTGKEASVLSSSRSLCRRG